VNDPPEPPEAEATIDPHHGADGATQRYVGLATRVIAFVVDAALINLVAIIVAVGAALILSLFHLPDNLKTVLVAVGGAAYILWTLGYFVVFWSTTGQTPGARVMQIRVITANGGEFKPRRAARRCIGVVLAALPLFAGYVLILFDGRRRGFQDRFAGTLVVEAPSLSLAAQRRARTRAAYESSRNSGLDDRADADSYSPSSG
jgi:uncharacterized RDD family membrane protein YckC